MKQADLILKSNSIFTGTEDRPRSGAVLIAGNRIMDVVPEQEIPRYLSGHTQVYDFQNKLIMPGLIDAHDHLWWGAVQASDHMADVTASTSEEECLEMIRDYAASHPDEKRIRGGGWFPVNWGDQMPTPRSLDRVITDRPAYLMCADMHTCWMNSLALQESGYYPGMKLPGGILDLDEDGNMTGLVQEPDAMIYAWNHLYDFEDHEIREILLHLMKLLAQAGVTSFGEMSADDYVDMIHHRYSIFHDMADRGEFTCRIHAFTKLMKQTDFSAARRWAEELNNEMFQVAGVKGFLDGVTSTYTGYLLAPYTDRPDTCGEGVPLDTRTSLQASVTAANAAGFPARIHCIGDAAVRMALDAYEYSLKKNGPFPFHNTIEHIESIDPSDLPRFKELNVIASVQGEHISLDANEKPIRIGKERCRWEWPFRSLLDAGATLAFGTDFPVVSYHPFPGIWAAVTRKNYDGSPAGVNNREEGITLAEALRANTLGAAAAYSREQELGSLEPDKLADVVVLDRDLFQRTNDDEIRDTSILMTIVDGKVVYDREERGRNK